MAHWPMNMPTKPKTLMRGVDAPGHLLRVAARGRWNSRATTAVPAPTNTHQSGDERAVAAEPSASSRGSATRRRRRRRAAAAGCVRCASQRFARPGRRRGSRRSSRRSPRAGRAPRRPGISRATSRSHGAIHSVRARPPRTGSRRAQTASRRTRRSRSSAREAAQLLARAARPRAARVAPAPTAKAAGSAPPSRRRGSRKTCAPRQCAQQQLERHGRRHRAEAARSRRRARSSCAMRSGGYHSTKRVERCHQAGRDAEADQRARQHQRIEAAAASANHAPPAAASTSSAALTRRGPKRSSSTPSGIWNRAKEKKYTPVRKPSRAADQAELARERRPEHGVHHAIDVRDEVARQERQGHPQDDQAQLSVFRARRGRSGSRSG